MSSSVDTADGEVAKNGGKKVATVLRVAVPTEDEIAARAIRVRRMSSPCLPSLDTSYTVFLRCLPVVWEKKEIAARKQAVSSFGPVLSHGLLVFLSVLWLVVSLCSLLMIPDCSP